jgi:hypothetical protein
VGQVTNEGISPDFVEVETDLMPETALRALSGSLVSNRQTKKTVRGLVLGAIGAHPSANKVVID